MTSGDRIRRSASIRVQSRPAPPKRTMAPRVAEPIGSPESFKSRAYAALRDAIVSMDVYRSRADIRLDERRLALDFGISRTPVREAMAQLEREGFVRAVPRRGIYVVRKTRREVIEMITAWAALESMAARLITENASADEIASLRTHVHQVRERQAARQARRIFRGEHRVSPDHHPHEPQRRAHLARGESVHAYADDPPQDHRRAGPRRSLDPRSYVRSSRRSRRATPSAPRRWCATTRSASPSTSRNTPTTWTDIEDFEGGFPWLTQQ